MAEKTGLPTQETKTLQKEVKILQKEIDVNGIKLSYKDNDVKGDTIVFLHRSSLSSDSFKNQFVAKEFQKYRLLAPDMPGHGNSKIANEPEIFYRLEALTQIIVNWIEKLKLSNVLFIGHSTGAHILMSAWPQISNLAKGLIVFGAPPFSKDKILEDSHYGHPSYALTQQGKLNKDEIENLAKLFVKKDGQVDPVIVDSIKKSDPAMRPIISQSIAELSVFDTESENIKQLTQPIAILQGRYDKILKRTYFDRLEIPKLWRKKVQLIDNAGHCPQLENPEQFNQMVQQFIIDQII